MNKSALGFKKNEFAKKLVGIVEVVTGEKIAKLTLLENGKKFANGETSIKVNLADLPKRPALRPNEKTPRQYRVRMNPDGDAVEALTPVRGLFKARMIDLGKRETKESDPAPYLKVWNEGKADENSHMEFFAVYEIVEGPFKGVQLPAYNLHYKFEDDPADEGFTRFSGDPSNSRATRLHALVEWGEIHGNIWSEPVRWPDDGNILPELLERVLDLDKEVNVFIDKGYIQSLQPVEDYGADEVVDVDDSDAVDEMLDGDDEDTEVTLVEIKSKAASKSRKPSTKATKVQVPDADDDL